MFGNYVQDLSVRSGTVKHSEFVEARKSVSAALFLKKKKQAV